MESRELSPTPLDTSRPSLGFPLGTALLLLVLFSLSGIFSCCYHWDKVRSLRLSSSPDDDDYHDPADVEQQSPSSKSAPPSLDMKPCKGQSLTVLMPGDELPKFMALPSPCKLPRPGIVLVKVAMPPKIPRFPVPLY
ncbi:hypothetical protein MLD38_028983 [Melastoma candidum]|uniref:Uncharacterized protein n=1 Tax=Melastoma candidum TaxID=119954 RepID=A0ACB9N521_9MYRT|nr:hypothetical protein MLD38_028983 [Melastoma candidum]